MEAAVPASMPVVLLVQGPHCTKRVHRYHVRTGDFFVSRQYDQLTIQLFKEVICGGEQKLVKIHFINPLLDAIVERFGTKDRLKIRKAIYLVGHTTTRITESRYLRVQNEACQDALERFDQRC